MSDLIFTAAAPAAPVGPAAYLSFELPVTVADFNSPGTLADALVRLAEFVRSGDAFNSGLAADAEDESGFRPVPGEVDVSWRVMEV